jgi:hypothetical protein
MRDGIRDGREWARVEKGEKLEYAWCVEGFVSGWPHVHIAHNLAWLERGRAIEAWAAATRLPVERIHQAFVEDPTDTARYLVKYLSKAVLTLCVLVLLEGKHLIGSTMKRKKPEPQNWQLLRVEPFECMRKLVIGTSEKMLKSGCVVVKRKKDDWSVWSIPDGDAPKSDARWSNGGRGQTLDWILREVVEIRHSVGGRSEVERKLLEDRINEGRWGADS